MEEEMGGVGQIIVKDGRTEDFVQDIDIREEVVVTVVGLGYSLETSENRSVDVIEGWSKGETERLQITGLTQNVLGYFGEGRDQGCF